MSSEAATGDAVAAGLSGPERNKILYAWNDTRAEYPDSCAHELFEQQVERNADAVALVFGQQRLTYRELNRRANQIAHLLRNRGVGPDTLVGVSLERSPELVVALLGVWKSGGAYVPLDPAYPAERLSFMVGDAGIRMLLTEKKCRHLFPSGLLEAVCLDTDWSTISQQATGNPRSGAAPSNLAYVMYTSGSTGQPKGAMILHRGLVNYLWWAIRAYGIEEGGSVPVHTSISFDLTVTSLYPALLAGGQAELLPEDVGAQHLLSALRRRKNRSLVKITPAHLDLLNQQLRPEEAAGLTKTFVIGGENLLAESVQLWRDFAPGTRLINEYGPTETVVGCCVYEVQPGDPRNGSMPIGRPIANTQLYVLDSDREPVPLGVTGELYIGGDGVARGYLNRPELTEERFVADPFSGRAGARLYKTGDLARYRDDGILEYLGRLDDQVKIRGYRIELGEIEAALGGHPAVQSCAVLAREDTPGNKQLVGYVVPRQGETPPLEELRDHLKQRLPEYMVPAHLVLLESFPLTHNGKIDRRALPGPSAIDAAPSRETVGPRNELEKSLLAIWTELLNVENVGIHDDFFDLGGHSLLAMKALSRVRDACEVDLPPQSLFDNPTVAGLAAAVAEARGAVRGLDRIERRQQDGPCPASFAQEQIWFLDQLVPGSPTYNIVDVIEIRGQYDARAMKRAVEELARRHEVLRTAFSHADGRVIQIVAPAVDLPLPEVDLGSWPEQERGEAWTRIVREAGRKPFDLSRAPLLRATVVHVSREEHKMLLVIHHVISDEWSMEVIQDEVNRLYAAFSRGRPSPLGDLPVQYTDFACWHRARLQGELLRQQSAYWKSQLEGAPSILALPTDKPRPATPSLRGATELFALPRTLLQRLQALGRKEQATLFMVLEAAFAALLHRYTGQADILVGTPISGRTQTETHRLIGCFLNDVVLRSRFTEGETFRSLLRQVRERALGAYAHSDIPFERLVALLAPNRDLSRNPLFQAMFILHDRDGVSQVSKVSGHHELQTGTAKLDLTLFLSETKVGLEGLMEYSTDLFERETVRIMCGHYGVLLESIVCDPDQSISRLPMLSDAERRRLAVEWNDTAATYPRSDLCLHQLFERQAAQASQRLALVCGQATLTYGELDRRANQLARHLTALGVGPDVLVGLLVERSLEMAVALLAILKAGGAYVPLDPAFPPDRLAYMVQDSKMQVLITHRELDDTLRARPPAVVRLDRDADEVAKHGHERPKSVGPRREHLAYVLYTSGSTGLPKGVAIPHSAIVNFLLSMEREPGLKAADTLLAVTTLSFDIAALEIYLPLACGAKVVIASRDDAVDPQRLMKRMRESGCTVMQATPATWRALLEAGWGGSPVLRAFCGGEALAPDLAKALLPRCAELWNLYGPTETTVWSTVQKIAPADGPAPIGRPIANTQVYVLDAHRELVPRGAVGELYIGGDGLARGYLHRPELTRERFVPSPFVPGALLYRTGDLARWRSDGRLECLGRTDHQVKLRGYRIELGEIEATLGGHPGVQSCVVLAREDASGNRQLVGYVVARESVPPPARDLRSFLKRTLPEFMVPAQFVFPDSFPLTPNGKVDRTALSRLSRKSPTTDRQFAGSGTQTEKTLAGIWAELLGVERIAIDDDVFELGAHSLMAVKAVSRIRDAFNVDLQLRNLFERPTISGLAEVIDALCWLARGKEPAADALDRERIDL